ECNGNRLRRAFALRFDHVVDARPRIVPSGVVPLREKSRLLFGEDRQRGNGLLQPTGHPFQQASEMIQEPSSPPPVEPVLVVDELEEQRSLTVPVQGEGKSGPLEQLALPSLPCGTLAPKSRVEEVLVIDQQALEQRDAGSNSTPALNFREGRVFA